MRIFNASTCGDYCAKWLLRMAEQPKMVVIFRHLMDFGDVPFGIYGWVDSNARASGNLKDRFLELVLPRAGRKLADNQKHRRYSL